MLQGFHFHQRRGRQFHDFIRKSLVKRRCPGARRPETVGFVGGDQGRLSRGPPVLRPDDLDDVGIGQIFWAGEGTDRGRSACRSAMNPSASSWSMRGPAGARPPGY